MRMFIGVDVDAELKARIVATGRGFGKHPGVRWEGPDKLHLTLRFLGEVAHEDFPAVMNQVRRVAEAMPAFEFETGGAGVFPDLRKPRVLWVGVQDAGGGLAALAGQLNAAMTGLGFAPERLPFRPHLTVARLEPRAQVRPILTGMQADGGLRTTQSAISVVVFQSELRRGGSLYTRLAEHPLSGQPNQGELS